MSLCLALTLLGCQNDESGAKADDNVGTIEGFFAATRPSMEASADELCACTTIRCAQEADAKGSSKGFAAGFAYSRNRRASPELQALLTKPGAIVQYAQANLPWFQAMVRRVDGCFARLARG